MPKHTAIYVRVSTRKQNHRSQLPDLERWAESHDGEVKWYRDKSSGKDFDRPNWKRLEQAIRKGKVSQVVVWRLDRLGRNVSGLSNLFEDFQSRKINLISLMDNIDLATPSGRLMANVIASVAQYEVELRGDRIKAGQEVARENGKSWGGSKPGVRKKVSPTQLKMILKMKDEGEKVTHIAKAVGLSRPTIYDILNKRI